MDGLLLRELCELCGVTRRTVQGYEKFGLVSAVGKNKMGHLVYDKTAVDRIGQIKGLQKRGFTLREINSLDILPPQQLKSLLEKKLEQLIVDSADIQESISILNKMLEDLQP